MANREQKSSKEKRKPKADKPKAPAQVSSFGQSTAGTGKSKGGKKG